MRVIEAWLVEQSLMFGQSPHKGLRIILQSHGALSANHPIDDLIALRHRVKKDGISPSVQQLRQLQDLYADVKNDFRPQQRGES